MTNTKDERINICSDCADASHCGIGDDDPTFKVDDSLPCVAYECVRLENDNDNIRFNATAVRAMGRKDGFIAQSLKSGMSERVIYNTYILGDSVMERAYRG